MIDIISYNVQKYNKHTKKYDWMKYHTNLKQHNTHNKTKQFL